jgi:hypothetical protein
MNWIVLKGGMDRPNRDAPVVQRASPGTFQEAQEVKFRRGQNDFFGFVSR